MASGLDIWFVNIYPFWNRQPIMQSVAWLDNAYNELLDLAGGKPVIISETGWPSDGDLLGEALPNENNAAFYFINFVSWAEANNVDYFYFAAFDEPWKDEPLGVGDHWGVWDRFLNLKPGREAVFNGYLIEDNWSQ